MINTSITENHTSINHKAYTSYVTSSVTQDRLKKIPTKNNIKTLRDWLEKVAIYAWSDTVIPVFMFNDCMKCAKMSLLSRKS